MAITQSLGGFPAVNQLNEQTSDGQPDENARENCVAASIAASLEYLTGKPYNGDELHDAIYGQGYIGTMSAARFAPFCATQGVKLAPVSGSQAALIATLHREVAAGHPVLVTMPSNWATAPVDPVHPAGYTHVSVAIGEGAGMLRIWNVWGGFNQDESDAWWQARLCYGQVWPMSKVEASNPMPIIPQGWHDDGHTLTAANGVPVIGAFRDFVLAHPGGWPAWNLPFAPEAVVAQLELGNPGLGGGSRQAFYSLLLEWRDPATADKSKGPVGVIVAYVGREYALLQARVAQLEAQLQAAEKVASAPVVNDKAAEAVAALKSALGL